MIEEIDRMLRESIEYAHQSRTSAHEYIKNNVQELDDTVIDQHIGLYVNDYTLDIVDGIFAVEELLKGRRS